MTHHSPSKPGMGPGPARFADHLGAPAEPTGSTVLGGHSHTGTENKPKPGGTWGPVLGLPRTGAGPRPRGRRRPQKNVRQKTHAAGSESSRTHLGTLPMELPPEPCRKGISKKTAIARAPWPRRDSPACRTASLGENLSRAHLAAGPGSRKTNSKRARVLCKGNRGLGKTRFRRRQAQSAGWVGLLSKGHNHEPSRGLPRPPLSHKTMLPQASQGGPLSGPGAM